MSVFIGSHMHILYHRIHSWSCQVLHISLDIDTDFNHCGISGFCCKLSPDSHRYSQRAHCSFICTVPGKNFYSIARKFDRELNLVSNYLAWYSQIHNISMRVYCPVTDSHSYMLHIIYPFSHLNALGSYMYTIVAYTDHKCTKTWNLMQLFGGFLIALSSLPEWIRWVKYLSLFRYSLEVCK